MSTHVIYRCDGCTKQLEVSENEFEPKTWLTFMVSAANLNTRVHVCSADCAQKATSTVISQYVKAREAKQQAR